MRTRRRQRQHHAAMEIVRYGVWPVVSDAYNFLMRTSFVTLCLVLLGAWLGISVLFATAYFSMPAGAFQAEEVELSEFWDVFFASACVMSDVEIGARPITVAARLVYLLEVSEDSGCAAHAQKHAVRNCAGCCAIGVGVHCHRHHR